MQLEERKDINLDRILKAFAKMNAGFKEKYLSAIEKEMSWIMPLPDSEVVAMPGYDEEENKVGITFFVSKPKTEQKPGEFKFMDLITQLFIKTDFDKLRRVWSCVERMEKKGKTYRINSTVAEYSKKLGDYTIDLYISKVDEL